MPLLIFFERDIERAPAILYDWIAVIVWRIVDPRLNFRPFSSGPAREQLDRGERSTQISVLSAKPCIHDQTNYFSIQGHMFLFYWSLLLHVNCADRCESLDLKDRCVYLLIEDCIWEEILWFSLSFFPFFCVPVSLPIILAGPFHCALHFKPKTERKKFIITVRKFHCLYFVRGSK